MKTIANRLVTFAVSAVVLGTVAYGDTGVQAQIPFEFYTSQGSMPAGRYDVTENYMARGVIALHNTASNQWQLTLPTSVDNKDWGKMALTFRCDDGCQLVGVQTRTSVSTYRARKSARAREAALVVIPLAVVNGN